MAVSKTELQEIIDWLIEHFPKAFTKESRRVKPLSLGIMEEVVDYYDRLTIPPFSKKKLRMAISSYTSSNAYLRAHLAGRMRVDIYGHEVEPLTSDMAQYAKEKLSERLKKSHAN